jgi:hypothetical protein
MGKKQFKNKGKSKHKVGDAENDSPRSQRRSKRLGNKEVDADDYKLRESIEAGTYIMMCLRSEELRGNSRGRRGTRAGSIFLKVGCA